MAEAESEVVPTSGFKVRPLSKRESGTASEESGGARPIINPAAASDLDKSPSAITNGKPKRLRELTNELLELEAKLRLGGGPARIEKQHKQGKLTARERIDLLFDKGSFTQEIGLLVAYDQYDGAAPSAGVVTTVGRVSGPQAVVVANDATVHAGAWWSDTIKKILRAQEVSMRSRVPIIYLVDSAGVNLPYQGGVFSGQYGAARIFYYNSIMRRDPRVAPIAAGEWALASGGAPPPPREATG